MEAVKALGHNAVLVTGTQHEELVVVGRGIGFGITQGSIIDESRVEQTFRATADMPQDRLEALLKEIPFDVLDTASSIVELAMSQLGVAVGPVVILPLADHLAQAIQRAGRAPQPVHPLQWEIQQIYPAEYAVGIDAIALVQQKLNEELGTGEAAAIALHLINARFAGDSLAPAVKMTELMPRILDLVAQSTKVDINHGSMDVARFVTHLRYLFVRLSNGTQLTDLNHHLVESISATNPEAYQVALRVQYLLESTLEQQMSGQELAYLTLHLSRIMAVTTARPADTQ